MKIVDRKTFLQMPQGTVFCKFPLSDKGNSSSSGLLFAVQNPMIFEGSLVSDFCYTDLGFMTPVEGTDDTEETDILENKERKLGKRVTYKP